MEELQDFDVKKRVGKSVLFHDLWLEGKLGGDTICQETLRKEDLGFKKGSGKSL